MRATGSTLWTMRTKLPDSAPQLACCIRTAKDRRQMPDFHLTDQETNDLIDFLEFTSHVKTQGWPPKASG